MRGRRALLVSAALLAACGQQPTAPVDEPAGPDSDIAEGVAWEQLDQVEDTLPDRAAAAVITDPDALASAWKDHGFVGEAPEVNFDDHVVVLLAQPDDACPDELSGLEVVDGQLEVKWTPPPGGCNEPLIQRLHAVRVHRAVLGGGFSYGPDAPFEDEFAPVTIDLPGYDGEAPPPPELTQQMSDAELDAVFAHHPVARCGPEHDPLDVDGPTPEGDPESVAPIGDTNDALADAGIDIAREVVPFVDSSTDGRLAYFVGEDHADLVEKTLADRFGKEAPGIRIAKWAPTDVLAAHEALMPLMSGDREPGTIVGMTGPPGPVHIDMVDPTREALDAVADRVDPNLVCVNPQLSGVAPADAHE